MNRLLSLIILALAFLVAPAAAQEEILNFETRLEVESDGAFLVTERIQVRAEGFEIRRGIFRDFPTVRRLPSGLVDRTTFEVLSVTRDGRDEAHHEESIEGGTRLYIGQSDRFLSRGLYTYEITYRSRHQMGFFEDFDEVYWNATGNFWSFPIRRAVATIILPPGAQMGARDVFTGRFGSTKSNATITELSPNTIRFETDMLLRPREGLTVAVAFQKGLVSEPSSGAQSLKTLRDNAGIAGIFIGAIAVFGYMFSQWMRVGRDPERGIIIPRFVPPRGLSAAAMSWVHFRGHKGGAAGKSFMAALVSLGIKKQLIIDDETDPLTIRVHPERDPNMELPTGEATLMRSFFGSRDALSFTTTNASNLTAATSAFRNGISGERAGRYFKHNIGYTIFGVAVGVIAMFAFLVLFPATEALVVGVMFHFIGGLIIGFALTRAYGRFSGRAPETNKVMAIAFTITAIAIVFALVMIFHRGGTGEFATAPIMQLTMIVAALMGATITTFAKLMFAPTPEGQEVMDEIDGFKLYLSVAEAERMNMAGKPDFTLELFERFLPYAIALGVEKPWSKALEGYLDKMQPGQARYRPTYYRGSNFDTGSIAASTAAIASTIGAAYASSMPKSSGSSGSGGGSSGGGGGGGGGGGW